MDRASVRSAIIMLGALAISAVLYARLPFEAEVRKSLGLTVFIGVLWLTEALPLAVVALLVPLGALLLGFEGLTTQKALAPFADPIVFLFLGGFALAAALRVQQLDRKMAVALLALSRGHLGAAVGLLFAATALLSMGISNTATAAMMLPLTMGVLRAVDPERDRRTHTFVLLGVAYAASLGGLGTLVGSPPNALAARAAGVDFAGWLRIGLPLVGVLMPLMVLTLWLVLRPRLHQRIPLESEVIPWTRGRVLTLLVFALTALGWTLGGPRLQALGIQSSDTFFALAALVAVVWLGLASWAQLSEQTDWGVLILFGGGAGAGRPAGRLRCLAGPGHPGGARPGRQQPGLDAAGGVWLHGAAERVRQQHGGRGLVDPRVRRHCRAHGPAAGRAGDHRGAGRLLWVCLAGGHAAQRPGVRDGAGAAGRHVACGRRA